jgi:DNA-binding MarR family transcriptional regulator
LYNRKIETGSTFFGEANLVDEKLNVEELQTTHYLHALVGDVLSLLSEHFKGQTTLNDLRIGNYIGLASHYEGRATNNKDISDALGISRPTVSRIVTDFIEQRWVIETPDPDDGRRKQIKISAEHPLADNFEKDFRVLINNLLQLYESRKVTLVDPSKKSF